MALAASSERCSQAYSWTRGSAALAFAEGMTMGKQVAVQALGVAAAAAWCALMTFVILKVLSVTVGFRVSEEQESEGLDLAQHGERGYSE